MGKETWLETLRFHLKRGPVIVSKWSLRNATDSIDTRNACRALSKMMIPKHVQFVPLSDCVRVILLTLTLLACSFTASAQQRSNVIEGSQLSDRFSVDSQERIVPLGASTWKPSTWKPFTGPMSIASSAVCIGSSVADIVSSQGLQENNPLLRNSRGEMSNAKAMLTLAPCGISYIFERKHPRAVALFRFAFGSVRMGLAIHNWKVK